MNIITKEINEVDTNQWNGLIHYANNGLPHAYKWYIKSISKDAQVAFADDYFCGKVVLPQRLTRSVANLLPLTEYFQMDRAFYIPEDYPSSQHYSSKTDSPNSEKVTWYALDFNRSATELESTYYSPQMVKMLDDIDPKDVTISNGGSPDQLISSFGVDNELERILVRIHYNAMQRGIAFSSAIVGSDGKHLASSLFVYSHNALYEIMAGPQSEPEYLAMLYHLMMKNHAMKPMKFHFALGNPFVEKLFQNLEETIIYRTPTDPDPKRIDDGYRPRNIGNEKKSWFQKLLNI